ncbi:uncharacterized protein LOC113233417 [Hyposmocoma kahamanoa]|uniref:uncharacterized protein LOC113233417 n=1 Tax=Hyposmocoma kahamanoa TaxID=1477025 RepID=UPI000E6D766C|nr:uncharacterized protein LOC113233417 [Hyposmocoma kahamanoa]
MWMKSIVYCAIVSVALGALARGPLYAKPDKFHDQEGCYIPEMDAMIPLNQLTPSTHQCMGFRCGKAFLIYESCTVVETGPPGRIVQDRSKPYPDCCPKVVV